MLEATGGYGEVDRFFRGVAAQKGEDEAAREGVAAADAVHDGDVVTAGEMAFAGRW